jgi:hypothetical protein
VLSLLNSLQVTEVTRTTGTTDVSVGYTVDKDGSPLSATEAVTAASSISDLIVLSPFIFTGNRGN